MAVAQKSKITCFECHTSFLFDLNRLPPDVNEKKCIKCGAVIPLVNRIIQAKKKPAKKPAEEKSADKSDADDTQKVDYAALLVQSRGGSVDEDLYDTADEGGSWLATYGDIMSLLLIFFILMFAISTIDKNKFEAVMSAISESLGGKVTFAEVGPDAQEAAMSVLQLAMEKEKQALSNLYQRLAAFVVQNNLQDQIGLADENEHIVLMAKGMSMFDSGSAELRAEMRPVLTKISQILQGIDNLIAVEGHTDNVPINTPQFPSNWELSTSRAANVVHFLVDECGMDARQLSVAGYSHYKPRFDFDTPEGKLNRRIEILIKKKYSTHLTDQFMAVQQQ